MHREILDDEFAVSQQQMIIYALVGLISLSLLSSAAWLAFNFGNEDEITDPMANWVDPVIEIEDDNHSHTDLLAHRLKTDNIQLIDYHNLNCDGNEKPPAELDNTAGRPCLAEFKNTGPTPGDNSEIAIEEISWRIVKSIQMEQEDVTLMYHRIINLRFLIFQPPITLYYFQHITLKSDE